MRGKNSVGLERCSLEIRLTHVGTGGSVAAHYLLPDRLLGECVYDALMKLARELSSAASTIHETDAYRICDLTLPLVKLGEEMGKESQRALAPRGTKSSEEKTDALKSWALVELMGHQRIVGWLTVHPPEFPELIRVDVPDLLKDGKVIRPGLTRYVAPGSLYGVTPITEEAVRQMLPQVSGAPSEARAFTGWRNSADEY